MIKQLPPLSLYIHFPWCVQKCPYCDFNSHNLKYDLPETHYIEQLLQDLQQDLCNTITNRPIISIFMGGGTPSLFSPQAIKHLLTNLRNMLPISDNAEITLEANPGTVEQQRFTDFRDAGVNRLSIGIQSFQAEKLKVLGRIHDNQEAVRAAEAAHAAGFTNFNLDLMFALPKQTIQDALYDLQTAVALKPTHLSWYHLTIEPHTAFYHKPPPQPDQELLWDMQQQGQDFLAQQNYRQYEISAYSLPNYQCQHNLNYWQFGDYIGIGAGAHSKITDIEKQTITRSWKIKHPKDYLNAVNNFVGSKKIITPEELPLEFMMNTMRLYQSITAELFTQRTGLTFSNIENLLKQAEDKNLLQWNQTEINLTEKGRLFLDDVLGIFLL